MKLSNFIVGLINLTTTVLSVLIIALGVHNGSTPAPAVSECEKFLGTPFLVVGISLLLLSLFGLIGSCCRSTGLLWTYLSVLFLLIVVLGFLNVLAFLLMSKEELHEMHYGALVSNRLDEYSSWARTAVEEERNWYKIKTCLKEADACQETFKSYIDRQFPYARRSANPIQDGCCKPPTGCSSVLQKDALWPGDADCGAWSTDLERLCFDCDACKAGFLAGVNTVLHTRLASFSTVFLVFLVLVYSIGCCALRNSRRSKHRHQFNH